MPIIYMHGVNTRDPKHFEPIREYLRRIVAPAIANDPENVSIRTADWYPLCSPPKWEGISRPRTVLLSAGAEVAHDEMLDSIVETVPRAGAASSSLTSGNEAPPEQSARMDRLPNNDLADLIALSIPTLQTLPTQRARIGIAADRVARNPVIRSRLAEAKTLDGQLEIIADAVQRDVEAQSSFEGAGALDFLSALKDRVQESLSRAISKPTTSLSVVAGELRPTLNDFVTRFLGDVLFYVTLRGSAAAPGAIPSILIEELRLRRSTRRCVVESPSCF